MSAHSLPYVLTIDLEDWFHCLEPDPSRWRTFERRIEVGTYSLLELLDHYRAKATFFVLGEVAERSPKLVREIAQCKHEVGSHGMFHRFVYQQTRKEFREDLQRSIHLLESITGIPVHSYRAPYFSITAESLWALRILRDEGIRHDSSIFPVHNHRYGLPWARRDPHLVEQDLWEWPISVLPTPFGNLPFSGGVYLRFLPWWMIAAALRAIEIRQEPLIIYLHPWELDNDQPLLKTTSQFLRLRHYYGLGDTRWKLERILKRAQYVTLADGIRTLQLNRAGTVK